MSKQRITQGYLRLRSGIALVILLSAAIGAFLITLSGRDGVARRAENTQSLDLILVSLAELSLAFDELKNDPAKQRALIAIGRVRRSALMASGALVKISDAKSRSAFSEDAQKMMAQTSLNPLVELGDILFLTNFLTNPGKTNAEISKAATLASDLSRQLIPAIMQIKNAEVRTGRADTDAQLIYALIAVAIGALGVLVAARFVHLPMERYIIKAQSEIETSRRTAEAGSEAKSMFLATMSHEIRTPLNGVLGLAELLQDTDLDDEQRHMIHMMIVSGNSLLRILNDVLDLSKIEAGKFEMETETFDALSLCQDVVDLFSAQKQSKNLDLLLTARSETTNWRVLGHGKAVRQIVLNLVSNAIKFTESGAVEIELNELTPLTAGKRIFRLVVRDSGVGVAPEFQERIFDQFAQADASTTTRFGGTGLGLAIVKRLTEAMNGKISMKSTLGEGSEFVVEFPVQEAPAVSGISGPDEIAVTFNKKILVADDNRVNRLVVSKMLERMDCVINTAANGIEAIELEKSWSPDLILMDVRMPEMDGLDATRAIRVKERELGTATLPIIGLSANAMDEHRNAGMSAGMSGYLSKPIRKADLAEVLTRLWPDENSKSKEPKKRCV
ncbi:ATP-binding protein [Parasedimentitalea psychrophila]|uniref:Sensory/regulatory protein RpfC n=1 Tax=Parasedimentitalea psychrophila TaxID=2997337 RepID=A0A9Y2KYZ0_9RHOB|nr:ATP-binding protein [Parasedimentitalea psychrophila]WIY25029.1 response regulator [Parasedimentitalea psychrophila]